MGTQASKPSEPFWNALLVGQMNSEVQHALFSPVVFEHACGRFDGQINVLLHQWTAGDVTCLQHPSTPSVVRYGTRCGSSSAMYMFRPNMFAIEFFLQLFIYVI